MAGRVEQVRLAEVAPAAARGGMPEGRAFALPADPSAGRADAALGAQLQQAGGQLDRAGNNLGAMAVRVQTENNETEAKANDTQFNTTLRGSLFDPEKGYLTKQGKDAFESYKGTEEELRKAQSEQAAKITNPEARKMFNDITTRRLDAALDTMAKHSAIERRKWVDGVSMTRAANAGDDAIAYASDPAKREAYLNVGRQEIISNGADHGEDPEITQRKLREYDTKGYSGIVQRMMVDDPIGAQQFYEANKQKIDGQQQIGLERTLKEATGRRRADDDANGVMGSGVGGDTRDNNIGNITKSGFKYSGGKGKGEGSFETFTTPEAGVAAAAQTIDAKAKANGGKITATELIGGNERVKGWAPADDGKGDPLLKGNNVPAYATVLAKAAGVGPNDPLPIDDPEKMAAVLKAMNKHEHGKQTVPDTAYKAGLDMARGGGAPAEDNLKAADAEMKLTPQEKDLYRRHLGNVAGPGGVDNADGSRSTLYQMSVEHDGKVYNVPTVWNGKILKPDDAIKEVEKVGWAKFPSYKSQDEAEARYQKMHDYMEKDTKALQTAAPKVATSTDPREKAREIEANFGDYVAKAQALYKDDPERLDKALTIIRQRKAIAEESFAAQLKVDTENAWKVAVTPVNGVLPTTQDAIPPNLWTKLDPRTQESLRAQFLHNLKGTDVVTDQSVWYELQRNLSSEDPKVRQEWAKKSLLDYKGKLSASDFQELAKMQGAIVKGDPEGHLTAVRGVNQLVDDTLNKLGIDPTPKPSTSASSDAAKAAKFRQSVQEQLAGLEKAQGKKTTPEQQQQVIDGLTKQVVTGKGWFGDNTKPRFQVTIEDVPAEEKAKIVDALKRAGKPPSDALIVDLFSRKNAKVAK